MNARRTHLIIFILMLSTLLWAGCGARNDFASEAPSAGMAPQMEAPAGAPVVDAYAQDAEASLAAMPAAQIARKVVATASMTLVVADTATMVGQIEAILEEAGGYVANTNLYKSNYNGAELLRGTMTLRIPSERLSGVMSQLGELAEDVRSENLSREDVTDQYSDVEAQLRNLRTTEGELLALLAEVREKPNATPEDIMAVHRNITEIRGQIEQLQGRQNMLDNLVSLSTLTIELVPDAINLPVVEEGWRPAVIARDATRALVNTLQFFGNAAIWIGVYLLPLVVLALIPLSIIVWLLRRIFRRLGPRPATEPNT